MNQKVMNTALADGSTSILRFYDDARDRYTWKVPDYMSATEVPGILVKQYEKYYNTWMKLISQ